MKAREMMEKDIKWCRVTDDVKRISYIFLKHRIGSVMVKDGDKFVGIVTKTDMMLPLFNTKRKTARDVMTESMTWVDADAELETIVQRMTEKRCHHILVRDGEKYVGIVSTMDILRCAAVANNELRFFADFAQGKVKLGPQWEVIVQDEDFDIWGAPMRDPPEPKKKGWSCM